MEREKKRDDGEKGCGDMQCCWILGTIISCYWFWCRGYKDQGKQKCNYTDFFFAFSLMGLFKVVILLLSSL